VLRTRVGYCGGTTERPTYRSIGDHTEAVAIDFDPEVTSYRALLGHFWASHHCGRGIGSTQYRNAIFVHDAKQRQLAEETRAEAAAARGIAVGEVRTAIVPAGEFTYAEAYHQKYYLTSHRELRRFLAGVYPSGKALADSTVATRLNAYLGSGIGRDRERLEAEIGGYGLPEELAAKVLAMVR
jgi:peptide-methionine (S)-S-oxide reductase